MGHLDTVFPGEYRKEILHFIYCHQVHTFGTLLFQPDDKSHGSFLLMNNTKFFNF